MASRISLTLAIIAAAAAVALPARAADYPPTRCDELAANPEDQDVIAPPVPRARVDLPAAIAACERETSRHPDNARARYQLSRVLAYDGQGERASLEMRRAADDGYRQAQFVYGLLIDRGRDGAPSDPCVTEAYWLSSARAGRQAARISYVRHVLAGRFLGCRVGATDAELAALLAAAGGDAGDYIERLLIADLSHELAARTSRPAAASTARPPAPGTRSGEMPPTDCDRLAAHPEDPDIRAPGVPGSAVDIPRALAACISAVSERPTDSQQRYQLARVLAYSGDSERAAFEMKQAADAGHRQAQFVYGLLIDRERVGAPRDICLAERYWLRAAQAGRQAARVLYVQRALQGRFDNCAATATRVQLGELLEAAAGEARDFYERIVIEELWYRLKQRGS